MKHTRDQILNALNIIRDELDEKHSSSPDEIYVTIRPTESELASDATDEDGSIPATGHEEIADWLDGQ